VLWVELAQWGLGCFERFEAGEGEAWLDAAAAAADYLVEAQERGGTRDGAFLHREPMAHTFYLPPPWTSAMAQGECASLLLRVHRERTDERYADAARRALAATWVPSQQGGASAILDGDPFPEEYPTQPPSFVLNGAIFALWGFYDAGIGLGDDEAMAQFERGVDTLARNIGRWDTGYWSYYDLFPHPVRNVATAAYHQIHITQLRANNAIAPRAELEAAADRWEAYAASRLNAGRVLAKKVMFRLAVPRSPRLAHRLPWSHAKRSGRRAAEAG
jgi:heparosan-N-sulfate-glucuronate 5-epimerase